MRSNPVESKSHGRRGRRLFRIFAVPFAVLALFVVTAGPASAERCDEGANGGRVHGTFGTADAITKWDLKVQDASADGDCVYIEVQVDLAGLFDPEWHSDKACGADGEWVEFDGKDDDHVNPRGSRVKICRTVTGTDRCETVDYNYDN